MVNDLFQIISPVILVAVFDLSGAGAIASIVNTPVAQTFSDWCLQQDELPDATVHTIQLLLNEAQTTNCTDADVFLSQQHRLDLPDRNLSDLRPLTSLPQLQVLNLDNNQISDLTPLGALSQLETLMIGENQVRDLSGLSQLNQLHTLFANGNQISDLEAIAPLPNLMQLYVPDNAIETVPELLHLTHLDLTRNRLITVDNLSPLINLVELNVRGNAISDISPLASLLQLNRLEVIDNPLTVKTCPVLPITICTFSDDAASIYQNAQKQLESGRYLAALELFEVAVQIYADQGDRARQLDALNRIGNIYDDLGQYANALDIYEQALCIATVGRDRPKPEEQCDPGKSQASPRSSGHQPEKTTQTSHDPQGEAISLARLGINRLRIGQFEKAVDLLTRSLAIADTLDGIDTQDGRRLDESFLAPIFDGLALAHARQGHYNKSLKAAKLSLGHYRNYDNKRGEAIALNRVGQAYLNVGNLDKAKIYFDKALDRTQATHDTAGQAQSLDSLGDYFSALEQWEEALIYYQKAQPLWQTTDLPAEKGKNLNAIGQLQLQLGQLKTAVDTLEQAVAIWESLRADPSTDPSQTLADQNKKLTDRDKISLADTQSQTYQLLQKALVSLDRPEQALEVSEQGRARAFVQLLAYRLSLRGDYPPATTIEPPDIEAIKQIAHQQKATLVEYSLLDNELYIWVIPPSEPITLHVQPLQEGHLPDLIEDYQNELQDSSAPNPGKTAGQQLYELLIQPITEHLPTDKEQSIIIIPHHELFLISFAALDDPSGTYLIDRHPLLFAPAIRLLNISSPSDNPLVIGQSYALIVGNPTMPIPPNQDEPLADLEFAQKEALGLEAFLGNDATDVLIGDDATEAAVRAQIETINIAHFATHGLLDDFGTEMPGAIALAPTETEEGFLTTQEIMELSLKAQLVVLSN